MDYQLHRYNTKKQTVETRPTNRGAEITDHLPTLKINPDELNMWADLEPVREAIGGFSNMVHLILRLELPKWWKYGKFHGLYHYGWRVLWRVAMMNFTQWFSNLLVSRNRESDLGRLRQEIKEYAAEQGYISGVTRVDRRFIAEARDEKMLYDTVLMLGMEMDKALVEEIPTPRHKL
ncbi:MAG: hypothetical protein ACWGSD_18705, partial [Thermodesulfobacteriota bacterium]